ncbi:MAG TPA: M55 family metallopeptidase [Anaerolineales bacterium]|nr:M55 family metallopeptidase [Anaerolineales bacterium]
MKIYISADIEGITGTTHWDETDKKHADYGEYQEQMTAEVVAACEGALAAGATELWVRDAHDSARNILAGKLPRAARLVRGWSGHPFMMMDGLDESFRAAMMIGYHARGGSDHSPLAHTMSGGIAHMRINERYASEFMINTYTAALVKTPVVFVSGDAGLCQDAAGLVPSITSVAVKENLGEATINIHPALAVERIRSGAQAALAENLDACRLALPEHFKVEVCYKSYIKAYGASFYPGVRQADPFTIQFETDDYFEVLRLFAFVL